MDWLNYHHLRYFWVVAREGSITRAGAKLRRSLPTVSAQIQELEDACGSRLLVRTGRKLTLTETGQQVFRYAEEIFSIGKELMETLRGNPVGGRPMRLVVGISDSLTPIIAHRLLEPVFNYPKPIHVTCLQGKTSRLLYALSMHEIDVVLSDGPATPTVRGRAFSHLLGECGITIFGAAAHARLRRGFPRSLNGAPILLPSETTVLGQSLDQWFEKLRINPKVLAEFDSPSLLKHAGRAGLGVFAAPTAVEAHVRRFYGVQVIGRTEEVRERFYAITVERKVEHPVVSAISHAAKSKLFR